MSAEAPESGEGQPRTDPPDAMHVPDAPVHVFISYASQDAAAANAIVAALERQGLKCWIAPRDVIPGSLYADGIARAIAGAKILALVLSEHAIVSSHVGKEIERASSKRRPIIALRIDLAPLSPALEYFLSESQWINVGAGGMEAASAKLVEAAQRHVAPRSAIEQGAVSDRHPVGSNSATPRTRWIFAAAATVVAVALVYFFVNRFWLSNHAPSARSVAAVAPAAAPAAPAISDKSVAVLPFVDMSEMKDQEYFSDGLSEELIALLTKVRDLRVPARTSSFYFKGKQATIADIAKALNVTHVLEGSVRKSGHTLRITAQLIRVDSGYHVWSETYDRQLDDIFKIQDDIAGSVVEALKVSLLGEQLPRATPTANSEAYTLYLRAQSISFRGNSSADNQMAIDYLHESLKLDPKFAPAWAALANIIAADFSSFGSRPLEEARAQAHEAANQARKLDTALPYGHLAMGRLLYEIDWSWQAAEAEIKLAIALEPGDAEAGRLAGYIATTRGRFDEAIEVLKGAIARDPLQPWNYVATGFATYRSGRLAEAEANYRKALDLNPTGGKLHYLLGSVLLVRGQPTAALAEMERETDMGYRRAGLALAFDALGRRNEADRELAVAERAFGNEKGYWLALVYASRKDPDRAFAWLDRAFRQHDGGLLWIEGDPLLVNLRGDARYTAILRKMNLPE